MKGEGIDWRENTAVSPKRSAHRMERERTSGYGLNALHARTGMASMLCRNKHHPTVVAPTSTANSRSASTIAPE